MSEQYYTEECILGVVTMVTTDVYWYIRYKQYAISKMFMNFLLDMS